MSPASAVAAHDIGGSCECALAVVCHRGGGGRGAVAPGAAAATAGMLPHQRRQVGDDHDENKGRAGFRRLVTEEHL